MKKIALLLLLFIPLAFAGKSIELDFNDKESYIIPMYIGDRIFFEFDDDVHTVILDDIKENRIEFDIFLYQNTKFKNHPPHYAFLDMYRDLKIDANKDKIFDFNININDFDKNKAIITFTKIYEEKDNPIVDLADDKKDEPTNINFSYDWRLILGGGVIILLIIIYSINKIVIKRKETYF